MLKIGTKVTFNHFNTKRKGTILEVNTKPNIKNPYLVKWEKEIPKFSYAERDLKEIKKGK